ncbi:MAG TPA: alpha/beta hydrolase [Thermomicrobiales bacterium]|nr:alpha/beta hydrolase [Thermomicrobiales bacterium]
MIVEPGTLPVSQWRDVINLEPGVQLAATGWIPRAPKGVVLLSHGHAEHLGRYGHVVSALVSDGFAVYGLDHRGHGRSTGLRAMISDFDRIADDLHVLGLHASRRHHGLPIVLIGHSMGGLIALRYALRYQAELAALVTSGPAVIIDEGMSATAVKAGRTLASRLPLAPVPRARGQGCGLSTDRSICEQFGIDHRTWHGDTRLGTAAAMLDAGEDTRNRFGELRLPLLAMHGANDTVTYPSGTQMLYDGAASQDKTIILWKGLRHELFNAPNRTEVIGTMRRWLNERIG